MFRRFKLKGKGDDVAPPDHADSSLHDGFRIRRAAMRSVLLFASVRSRLCLRRRRTGAAKSKPQRRDAATAGARPRRRTAIIRGIGADLSALDATGHAGLHGLDVPLSPADAAGHAGSRSRLLAAPRCNTVSQTVDPLPRHADAHRDGDDRRHRRCNPVRLAAVAVLRLTPPRSAAASSRCRARASASARSAAGIPD
jgi:hypothetical protein